MTEAVWIDHIGVVGPDLSALEAAFRHCGFTVAPRCELVSVAGDGTATPLGQVNSHLVFGSNYVELTAVEGDIAGHHLEHAIARYFGLHILVLSADNADRSARDVAARGFSQAAVALAGRDVDYPGGAGSARFRWFAVPQAEFPEAFVCFVEQVTPELVFDATLNDHANGARNLAGICICSQTPAESAAKLARMTGTTVEGGSDEATVGLAGGYVLFVSPQALERRYPGVRPPALPWCAGFAVDSNDLDATERDLKARGIVFHRRPERLWLEPSQCGGAIVEFRPAD